MEALNRMVADSLARHGLDRPIDPRRLQWSRWFRCDSTHSLLVVPSKPGIFALAEDVMDLGTTTAHVGTDAFVRPAEQSSAAAFTMSNSEVTIPHAAPTKRMLAVLRFSEDDDMAFTLDRMFTLINPMRARLSSGRCFLRFVVIEDQDQRRSICTALNQWLLSSAEKATGIGADFSFSLELRENATEGNGTDKNGTDGKFSAAALALPSPDSIPNPVQPQQPLLRMESTDKVPYLDSGANKNLHCPQPFPSGF